MRQHVGTGTGNDHLPHEIDELVQLRGLHADKLRFEALLFGDLALLDRSGFHYFRSDGPLIDQYVPNLGMEMDEFSSCIGLCIQRQIQFILGQGTALDQYFAQTHGVFGQGLD